MLFFHTRLVLGGEGGDGVVLMVLDEERVMQGLVMMMHPEGRMER
jgi:hypothetical protein